MTAQDWIRTNLPTKGDADDVLPGNNDEVVLFQGVVKDGQQYEDPSQVDDPDYRIEHVRSVETVAILYGDLIDDYRKGTIDKAAFKQNAKGRAANPSTDATTLNSRDPHASDRRDWATVTDAQDEDRLDFWERMDAQGRL